MINVVHDHTVLRINNRQIIPPPPPPTDHNRLYMGTLLSKLSYLLPTPTSLFLHHPPSRPTRSVNRLSLVCLLLLSGKQINQQLPWAYCKIDMRHESAFGKREIETNCPVWQSWLSKGRPDLDPPGWGGRQPDGIPPVTHSICNVRVWPVHSS